MDEDMIRQFARDSGLSRLHEDATEYAFDFAAMLSEAIAARIEAHLHEPQVMVVRKITDTPREVMNKECAAIARMIGKEL